MLAVVEAALAGQLVHVGERLLEPLAVAVPQADGAHPGRVDQHPAARQRHQLPVRRGVAAAAILAHVLRGQPLLADQPVDQGRLTRARQAQQRHRAAVREHRIERVHALAGGCAERDHVGAEGDRLGLQHVARRVVAEVGLRQQDHGPRAALPAQRQVALQPPQAEPLVERVHQQHDIDVRRNHLPDRLLARRLPGEAGAPFQQLDNHRVVAAGHGWSHRRPVADGRRREAGRHSRAMAAVLCEDGADAAVDAGDAPGHRARRVDGGVLLVARGVPAEAAQSFCRGRSVCLGPPGGVTHVDSLQGRRKRPRRRPRALWSVREGAAGTCTPVRRRVHRHVPTSLGGLTDCVAGQHSNQRYEVRRASNTTSLPCRACSNKGAGFGTPMRSVLLAKVTRSRGRNPVPQ